jgi:hypothetical protein
VASIKPKISKPGDTVISRHITLTICETLETIRKPGNATIHSVIMAAYKIGLLTVCGMKKHKEKNYL